MTKRAYELLVRFGKDESVAGAHVKEMHLDEQGNDIRETAPIPLADTTNPAFTAFADKFSAKTVAENEVLKSEKTTLLSEKATLESQVASLTTQVDAKTEQIETLTTEKSELVASHAEEKSELILNHLAEKATLTESLSAANARIAHLLSEVPFDPRIIDATAFYDRLTKDEVLTLFTSTDATTKQIGETILAYKTNDWPVVFGSTEFQQMLGYLLQSGTLTEIRMAELTRDATRAEAYQAD